VCRGQVTSASSHFACQMRACVFLSVAATCLLWSGVAERTRSAV
jgi:hypothetical protein